MAIKKIAVIGAGPSGLVAVKSLLEQGLEPVAFEKADAVGGLWRYDESQADGGGLAYRSLETNTSKWMGVFSDLPFEQDAPVFPSRAQMLAYLNRYADHFNLRPHIRLATPVCRVSRTADDRWEVVCRPAGGSEETQVFEAVVVASGFYSIPFRPELPGQDRFAGETLHSATYKGPEGFEGKRIVVVGCGSSGADLSAELGPVAAQVDVSTRTGIWFLPKLIRGQAYDTRRSRFAAKIPMRFANRFFCSLILDSYFDLGFTGETIDRLNLPEFDLLTGKFLPATEILKQVRDGAVRMKPEIAEVGPDEVRYVDGSVSKADVILFATGYGLRFPFLDGKLIKVTDRYTVGLYRQVFHPDHDTLAFLAMNFAGGAAFPLMEIEARWLARVFAGDLDLPGPEERRAWIDSYFARHEAAGTDPMSLSLLNYLEEVGELLGIRPRFLKHPQLIGRLFFGAWVPAQYRLDGPGRVDLAFEILSDQSYLNR